jgi:hypothetical protein
MARHQIYWTDSISAASIFHFISYTKTKTRTHIPNEHGRANPLDAILKIAYMGQSTCLTASRSQVSTLQMKTARSLETLVYNTLVGAHLCVRRSLEEKGKEIRGVTDREAYTVHTINIISRRQYFVARCHSSCVGNVFGLHRMCVCLPTS